MKGTTPPFENSDDMRAAAERGAERMRSAFGILVQGAQKAVVAFEERMRASDAGPPDGGTGANEARPQQGDGKEPGATATGSAAGDASSMLELVQKLGAAGNVEDLVRIQTVFVQAWMQILGEQARTLAPAAEAIVEALRSEIGNHPPELDFAKAKQQATLPMRASPGERSAGFPTMSAGQGFARTVTEKDNGLELDTIAALLDIANAAVDEARASAASTIKDLVRQ